MLAFCKFKYIRFFNLENAIRLSALRLSSHSQLSLLQLSMFLNALSNVHPNTSEFLKLLKSIELSNFSKWSTRNTAAALKYSLQLQNTHHKKSTPNPRDAFSYCCVSHPLYCSMIHLAEACSPKICAVFNWPPCSSSA